MSDFALFKFFNSSLCYVLYFNQSYLYVFAAYVSDSFTK